MKTRDLPRALAGESRRHVRIKDNTRLLWHIRENGLVGQGRVRNISTSGMLVELVSEDALPGQSLFSFDCNLNNTNYIPDAGHLVWRAKKRFSSDKYLCGFQFDNLPEVLAVRLSKRVDDGVKHLVLRWKAGRRVGFFLAGVTVALVGYAFWLGGIIFQDVSRSNQGLLATANQQADLTREYQRLYADTTRRLADVTLELNQTAALYQETRDPLATTRQELSVVKSILSATENFLAKAQAVIIPPVVPVESAQISLPSNAVESVAEGKALIAAYRDRIQEVGVQINQINSRNHLARISALAERDRIRLMYGNQGFFVKSGQSVQVDMRQYQAANFNALPPGKVPRPDSKVRVNVNVLQ